MTTTDIILTDNIRARLDRAGQADLDAWLAGNYYCNQQPATICDWIDEGHEIQNLDLDDDDDFDADFMAASQVTILEFCSSCDNHRTASHYFNRQGDLMYSDHTELDADDLADLMDWDADYIDEIRTVPNQFEVVAWLAEGSSTTDFLKCKHGYIEGSCQFNCELYDRTRFDDNNDDVRQLIQLNLNCLIAKLTDADADRQQLDAEFGRLLELAEANDLTDDLIFYMQDWQAKHQPADRLTLAVAELAATMSV